MGNFLVIIGLCLVAALALVLGTGDLSPTVKAVVAGLVCLSLVLLPAYLLLRSVERELRGPASRPGRANEEPFEVVVIEPPVVAEHMKLALTGRARQAALRDGGGR